MSSSAFPLTKGLTPLTKGLTMNTAARLALLSVFALTACHRDREVVAPRPHADVSSIASATSLPTPTARAWAAATVIDNGVYLVGGGLCLAAVSGCATFGQDASPVTEVGDPTVPSWIRGGDLSQGRWALRTALVNGKIYAIGGTSGTSSIPIGVVEEYDPTAGQWSTKAA